MTELAPWCASSSIFLSTTFCGSTTKKPIAWSIRCWTAGEEEHVDGNVLISHIRSEPGLRGELPATSAEGLLLNHALKRFGAKRHKERPAHFGWPLEFAWL